VLAGALIGALPARPVFASEPSDLAFAALRDGHRIGEERLRFETRGLDILVRTVAEFAVKLGPVSLFHYRHQASERWTGDRFESLETSTEQNGKTQRLTARREGEGVMLETADGPRPAAPASAVPFTHWNRRIAGAPLFDPQTGKLMRERVSAPTQARATLASGASVPAVVVVFRGDANVQDFYDASGVWTGLLGQLKDGSMLEYRRL
jgi:hypothetical protein